MQYLIKKQLKAFCSIMLTAVWLFYLSFTESPLLLSPQAMDLFDMGEGFASLEESVKRIQCPVLVLGVQTDMLIPSWQQKEVVEVLRKTGDWLVLFVVHIYLAGSLAYQWLSAALSLSVFVHCYLLDSLQKANKTTLFLHSIYICMFCLYEDVYLCMYVCMCLEFWLINTNH